MSYDNSVAGWAACGKGKIHGRRWLVRLETETVNQATPFGLLESQQWFTSVSHTRSWLCYYLLWNRKWTSHPGRGGKWVRDRDRPSIFYSIGSGPPNFAFQLPFPVYVQKYSQIFSNLEFGIFLLFQYEKVIANNNCNYSFRLTYPQNITVST